MLVACQKALDKQHRPRSEKYTGKTLIRLLLQKQSDQGLPVCFFDKLFVNSSPNNQCFIREHKEKSDRKFITFLQRCLVKQKKEMLNLLIDLAYLSISYRVDHLKADSLHDMVDILCYQHGLSVECVFYCLKIHKYK